MKPSTLHELLSKSLNFTAGWLHHQFKWGIRHELNSYRINTMKQLGGLDISSLPRISNSSHVIEALTDQLPVTCGGIADGNSWGNGFVTNEMVIGAFARLSIMGFGSENYDLLKQEFPDLTAELKGRKHCRVVPHYMLNALWYSHCVKYGDVFTFPDADWMTEGFVINNSGTHVMVKKRYADHGALLFVPLTASVASVRKRYSLTCPNATYLFEVAKAAHRQSVKEGAK